MRARYDSFLKVDASNVLTPKQMPKHGYTLLCNSDTSEHKHPRCRHARVWAKQSLRRLASATNTAVHLQTACETVFHGHVEKVSLWRQESDGKPNGQHVYHMAEVALAHVRHFVVNSNAPWTVRNRLTAAGAASLRMTRHCSCGNASFEIGPELVEIRSNLGPNLCLRLCQGFAAA